MIESPRMGIPKPGDIVLERVSGRSLRYTLTTSGHVPQIMCPTYDAAMSEAGRCARAHHLDVWETDDHRTFSRIVECRPVRET